MQLVPLISHQFNGTIWRMEIDPVTATLFAEIRNEGQKQVSFASVSLRSGKINFNNLLTEERWLTGMETACDGVLLLHNYQSPGSPEHKGLIAVDGTTGRLLWRNYNISFSHLTINGPAIFDTRVQPRKLFIADVQTGATVSLYNEATDGNADNNIVLPEEVSAENINIAGLPEKPYGNLVHYLYYNNYRIVSLHALKNDRLSQNLYIFKEDRQVYYDILQTGIQKLQPEAFLLHHHYLIFLKNRTELTVIHL